jgi:hypothetical protein
VTWWNLVVVASYLSIIAGSVGMMVFATKFRFSTRLEDLDLDSTTVLGLKGDAVWSWSWRLIIAGTVIQLLDYATAAV